jgi:uncharacterized protein YcbK (DUF882 family)
MAAVGAASAVVPAIACASQHQDWRVNALNKPRSMTLVRPDSKEKISLTYWTPAGGWDLKGYQAACWMLRDVKYGQAAQMDTGLLDTLFIMQSWLATYGYHQDVHILSGYRTKAHNDKLEGAAKNSMHLYGRAADIYMPGISPVLLSRMGQMLGLGGVGLYASRGFVHVDRGSVRNWRGA